MNHIKERNIALAIVFTLITFGIYGLYWIYCLTEDANYVTNHRNETSGGLVILFTIITFGIYGYYWAYKQGVKFRDEAANRGSNEADNLPALYLVLQLLTIVTGVTQFVNYALMQDKINSFARQLSGNNNFNADDYTYAKSSDE